MNDVNKKTKVGVFGHYGNCNLGDEAITTATIQHIRRCLNNNKGLDQTVEIIGMSVKPEDTAARYNIETYPIRYIRAAPEEKKFKPAPEDARSETQIPTSEPSTKSRLKDTLKKVPILGLVIKLLGRSATSAKALKTEVRFLVQSYRTLKDFDLLIVAGSNQFLDNFGGPWGFPYTLLKWALLAKLSGTKIAFVSVGAGPLDSPLSRFLVRLALLFADYVSYRDAASKALVETKLFNFKGAVYPDLASSLLFENKRNSQPAHSSLSAKEKATVAINPMPLYDPRYWCISDDDKYQSYVKKMAKFSDYLIKEGYPILFFSTQPKDENVVFDIINNMSSDLVKEEPENYIHRSRQVDELMSFLCSVDLVIATRFHGTVLSLLAETPVLGVCYYRKASDLLKEMGQDEYFVELDNFSVAELVEKFNTLVPKLEQEQQKIKCKNAEYATLLNDQYDRVFSLIS